MAAAVRRLYSCLSVASFCRKWFHPSDRCIEFVVVETTCFVSNRIICDTDFGVNLVSKAGSMGVPSRETLSVPSYILLAIP